MRRTTASEAAEALRRAGEDIGHAADQPLAFLIDAGAESLALAAVRLNELRRADKRYDFGELHQLLLEYLPGLVAHAQLRAVRSVELRQVAQQLAAMAEYVLELEGRHPKPLDITGAIAMEVEADTSALKEAREFWMPRRAGSPLPAVCPKGHRPRNLERRPEQIQGDVLDCVTCDACGVDYVLLSSGWFEATKRKEA